MDSCQDLDTLLNRLKANIDLLAIDKVDAGEVRQKISDGLEELQSRPDHIVRVGSHLSLVEVSARATLNTGYVGKRLASLLGYIRAKISCDYSWGFAHFDPARLSESLITNFHFQEKKRIQSLDLTSNSSLRILVDHLEESAPTFMHWTHYLSFLDSMTLRKMLDKLRYCHRLFDAECASFMLFCQQNHTEETEIYANRHLQRLKALCPEVDIADIYIGQQLYVFDDSLRRQILLDFNLVLILKLFPCLTPLYDTILGTMEKEHHIVENMMFPPYNEADQCINSNDDENFMAHLYQAITWGLERPYRYLNWPYRKIVLNLFSWESLWTSWGLRFLKSSICDLVMKTSEDNILRLEKHLLHYPLSTAFAMVVSDAASDVFGKRKVHGLPKSKSRLWFAIRFGIPREAEQSIKLHSGLESLGTLGDPVIREAAAKIGVLCPRKRASSIRYYLKHFGKLHFDRGNVLKDVLKTILSIQCMMDDCKWNEYYEADRLPNVCTLGYLHHMFSGGRIESPEAKIICNLILNFNSFQPISETFCLNQETLFQAWCQRIALYYPMGGSLFDIILPCIEPAVTSSVSESLVPVEPDIHKISFIPVKVLHRHQERRANKDGGHGLTPKAQVVFKCLLGAPDPDVPLKNASEGTTLVWIRSSKKIGMSSSET